MLLLLGIVNMPDQQEKIANFQKAGEQLLHGLENLSDTYPAQKNDFSKFYTLVEALLANFEMAPIAENLPKSQAFMDLYFQNFGHKLAQEKGLKQAMDKLQANYHLACNPARPLPRDGIRRGSKVSFFIGGDGELLSRGAHSSDGSLNSYNGASPSAIR